MRAAKWGARLAHILFWEKRGCAGNARQKALLVASGHDIEARDLREEAWTPERLRPFFGDTPISAWFNRNSPRLANGEVRPAGLDEAAAMALLLADPLLIRRPLMQVGERREAGFEPARVRDWIGLRTDRPAPDENCVRHARDQHSVRHARDQHSVRHARDQHSVRHAHGSAVP